MSTKFRDAELAKYMIHEIKKLEMGSESGSLYNYYLYIHPRGSVIIMRETQDELSYRYANGGFGTSKWENRIYLNYVTYDKLA